METPIVLEPVPFFEPYPVKFYLGIGKPQWLKAIDCPCCISVNVLKRKRREPLNSLHPYILDSGGYMQVLKHGKYDMPKEEYAEIAQRLNVGDMEAAIVQDYSCQPLAFHGRTLDQHLIYTIESWLDLRRLAPEVPWMPVLQGFRPDDFIRHWRMYETLGLKNHTFAVGSMGAGQNLKEMEDIVKTCFSFGVKLHALGIGKRAMRSRLIKNHINSFDTAEWYWDAMLGDPIEGHTHKKCSSCIEFAYRWRESFLMCNNIDNGKRHKVHGTAA